MLVACGFVRATTGAGAEFTFTPAIGRIAALGDPHEIVQLYADLHGANAETTAAYVLAGLCDQDDPSPLIGWFEFDHEQERLVWRDGEMPPAERVIIAHHLMRHGIIGKARPEVQGEGSFRDYFDASEYISAARVHLGLSSADAEALSMTELQQLFELKFPTKARSRDVPTREEYEAAMAAFEARRNGG